MTKQSHCKVHLVAVLERLIVPTSFPICHVQMTLFFPLSTLRTSSLFFASQVKIKSQFLNVETEVDKTITAEGVACLELSKVSYSLQFKDSSSSVAHLQSFTVFCSFTSPNCSYCTIVPFLSCSCHLQSVFFIHQFSYYISPSPLPVSHFLSFCHHSNRKAALWKGHTPRGPPLSSCSEGRMRRRKELREYVQIKPSPPSTAHSVTLTSDPSALPSAP